jgi:hypothetical protein
MTERCADLDEFFDGELAADQVDAFRSHLVTCARCERVLHGRMQESLVVEVAAMRDAAAVAAPPAAAVVAASDNVAAAAPPAAVVPVPAPLAPAAHVVASGRARRWRRAIAYAAAPVLAAAAAVPFICSSEPGFQLAVAFDRAPATERGRTPAVPQRGLAAHTGDVLRSTVQGERHQALWVFLDERELIARCPGNEQCRSANGELALELPLTSRGRYTIVAVGASEALPDPGATFDQAMAAAHTVGARTQVEDVNVD